jgi:hypothetical protein
MIDISKQQILTLKEAIAVVPKIDGKRPSLGSLYRWVNKGIRGVRLEVISIGGRTCTTRESLNMFFNEVAQASRRNGMDDGSTRRMRNSKSRELAVASANAALEHDGIE